MKKATRTVKRRVKVVRSKTVMVKKRVKVVTYKTISVKRLVLEPVYERFGQQVKAMRKARGWTQTDLADKMKYVRASIANIELGRQRILLHNLFEFAKVFEVLPQSIFYKVMK